MFRVRESPARPEARCHSHGPHDFGISSASLKQRVALRVMGGRSLGGCTGVKLRANRDERKDPTPDQGGDADPWVEQKQTAR